MSSNNPKVLVEFEPDEIAWLADQLHALRANAVSLHVKAASLDPDPEKMKAAEDQLQAWKDMEARIRNRILDKASDQGFGFL